MFPQAPRTTKDIIRDGNHLKDEPSLYLQQHAHNPVDWYPWGEEALAKAKAEDKPIFLSIGYSQLPLVPRHGARGLRARRRRRVHERALRLHQGRPRGTARPRRRSTWRRCR